MHPARSFLGFNNAVGSLQVNVGQEGLCYRTGDISCVLKQVQGPHSKGRKAAAQAQAEH